MKFEDGAVAGPAPAVRGRGTPDVPLTPSPRAGTPRAAAPGLERRRRRRRRGPDAVAALFVARHAIDATPARRQAAVKIVHPTHCLICAQVR